MPGIRITRSPFYTIPRQLLAGRAGAWAVPSPQARMTAGQRVAAGQLVGTTTGQLVRYPTQPQNAYFLEVRRPTGEIAWVLNTTTRRAAGTTQAVTQAVTAAASLVRQAVKRPTNPAPVAPRPARPAASRPAPPRKARPAPRPAATGDGTALLRNIVNNDQQTHQHLVQAYYHRAVARRAGAVGADNPKLEAALVRVKDSYNARQAKIRQSKAVKLSTGVTATVKTWLEKLYALVPGMSGIGALPVLAVPLLWGAGLLLSAAAAGALFVHLRKDEPKSAADAKEAFHVSKEYAAMNPEQQEATDKAIDDAARGGVKEGEDNEKGGLLSTLKNNVLLIGGGILAFSYFSKPRR